MRVRELVVLVLFIIGLSYTVYSIGLTKPVMLVNYTKPVSNDVAVVTDYTVQYAVLYAYPSDSQLVFWISSNCSDMSSIREERVDISSSPYGSIDLGINESLCQVRLANERIGVSGVPPTTLEVKSPGVMNLVYGLQTINGSVQIDFMVDKVVLKINKSVSASKVVVEWLRDGVKEVSTYRCNPPCSIEAAPPHYANSYNVYIMVYNVKMITGLVVIVFLIIITLGYTYKSRLLK